MFGGICPAACMALYCIGVMCSNPGGGTSQYREAFFRRLFLPPPSLSLERERDLLRRSRDLDRDLGRKDWHSLSLDI